MLQLVLLVLLQNLGYKLVTVVVRMVTMMTIVSVLLVFIHVNIVHQLLNVKFVQLMLIDKTLILVIVILIILIMEVIANNVTTNVENVLDSMILVKHNALIL